MSNNQTQHTDAKGINIERLLSSGYCIKLPKKNGETSIITFQNLDELDEFASQLDEFIAEESEPATQEFRYLVYYENATYSIPADREESVLQYIALRYIEKNEKPTTIIDPFGHIMDKNITQKRMQSLAMWYYEKHPTHRWQSRRAGILKRMEQELSAISD